MKRTLRKSAVLIALGSAAASAAVAVGALAQDQPPVDLGVAITTPTKEVRPGKTVYFRVRIINRGSSPVTGFRVDLRTRNGLVKPRVVVAPPDSVQTTCPTSPTTTGSTSTNSSTDTTASETATTDSTPATTTTSTDTSPTATTDTTTSTTTATGTTTTSTTLTSTTTTSPVGCKPVWIHPTCHAGKTQLSCRYVDLELDPGTPSDSLTLVLKGHTTQRRREMAVATVYGTGDPSHISSRASITIKVRPPY